MDGNDSLILDLSALLLSLPDSEPTLLVLTNFIIDIMAEENRE